MLGSILFWALIGWLALAPVLLVLIGLIEAVRWVRRKRKKRRPDTTVSVTIP